MRAGSFFLTFLITVVVSLFSISLTFISFANANIRIDSITGASNQKIDSNGTAVNIWGGVAGSSAGCSGTTDLCDSCTAGNLTACNATRIHRNLDLTINFTVTGDISGTIRLLYTNASSVTTPTDFGSGNYSRSTTGTISKNSSGSVTIPWSFVCDELTSDANCDTSGNAGKLYICVSSDTTCDSTEYVAIDTHVFAPAATAAIDCNSTDEPGVCGFEALPGDEKIFIQEIEEGSGYPNADDVALSKLVIFCSEGTFVSITHAAEFQCAELEIDSDGAISPDIVDGLENGVQYRFRAGVKDLAGNIYHITSDAEIAAKCSVDDETCQYVATPSDVYGLLAEDLNCFISTAAFNSSFAPSVRDFREFRNKTLLRSEWGRKIIFYYYSWGPKAARFLSEHAWLKPFVQITLLPAWAFAETSNQYSFNAALSIFGMGVLVALSLLTFFVSRFWNTKKSNRQVRR